MEKEFTCSDCRSLQPTNGDLPPYCAMDFYNHDPSEPICPYFETKDGKRPRYCRLASSVDEMAATLVVQWYYPLQITPGYIVAPLQQIFDSYEDALAAAKQYLMEVEE